MKRKIYKLLLDWKVSETRMPLLLKGVRQVGKSYILKKFGDNEFSGCHIFNFEQDKTLAAIFEHDLFPERIVSELSIRSGKLIDINKDPGKKFNTIYKKILSKTGCENHSKTCT